MTNDDTRLASTMTSRLMKRQLTLPDGTVLQLRPDDVVKFERVTEEVSRSPIDMGVWERTDAVEFAEDSTRSSWPGTGAQWATVTTNRKSVG